MRFTTRAILKNNNSNKILFIKYLDLHSQSTKNLTNGFWALLGGGIKKRESFKEALRREIYEETGIIKINIKNCVLSRLVYLDIAPIKNDFYYERYYIVDTDMDHITFDNLTINEKKQLKNISGGLPKKLRKRMKLFFPFHLPTI